MKIGGPKEKQKEPLEIKLPFLVPSLSKKVANKNEYNLCYKLTQLSWNDEEAIKKCNSYFTSIPSNESDMNSKVGG